MPIKCIKGTAAQLERAMLILLFGLDAGRVHPRIRSRAFQAIDFINAGVYFGPNLAGNGKGADHCVWRFSRVRAVEPNLHFNEFVRDELLQFTN